MPHSTTGWDEEQAPNIGKENSHVHGSAWTGHNSGTMLMEIT